MRYFYNPLASTISLPVASVVPKFGQVVTKIKTKIRTIATKLNFNFTSLHIFLYFMTKKFSYAEMYGVYLLLENT